MPENRISATLAPADKEAVMQAIATIREKLPFLVDLTPEDRRTMLKMGDKSRAFVSKALYQVRIISYDSHSHCTPPPAPPRRRGGETKHSFGGVGFLGFSKYSSGHDIRGGDTKP